MFGTICYRHRAWEEYIKGYICINSRNIVRSTMNKMNKNTNNDKIALSAIKIVDNCPRTNFNSVSNSIITTTGGRMYDGDNGHDALIASYYGNRH